MAYEAVDDFEGGSSESPANSGPEQRVAATPLTCLAPAALEQIVGLLQHPYGPEVHQLHDGHVPSLKAVCCALLGRLARDVVSQLTPADLALLPADSRAGMLCVARRRGALTNQVLLGLMDDRWRLLDVSSSRQLSERALRQALWRGKRLQALDLSDLLAAALSPDLLRQLPAACPELRLLKLGARGPREEVQRYSNNVLAALPQVLPHWQQQGEDGGAAAGAMQQQRRRQQQRPQQEEEEGEAELQGDDLDDWESAADLLSAAGPQMLGCAQLVALVWPAAPPLARHLVATICPHVALLERLPPLPLPRPPLLPAPPAAPPRSNGGSSCSLAAAQNAPASSLSWRNAAACASAAAGAPSSKTAAAGSAGSVQARGSASGSSTPAPACAAAAGAGPEPSHREPYLDDCLAAMVAPSAWQGLQRPDGAAEAGQQEEVLHIAEKFRRAYVEQDARLRAKAVKDAALEERRRLREGGAARAMKQWLDEA